MNLLRREDIGHGHLPSQEETINYSLDHQQIKLWRLSIYFIFALPRFSMASWVSHTPTILGLKRKKNPLHQNSRFFLTYLRAINPIKTKIND